jgi:small multidrug resistance pump
MTYAYLVAAIILEVIGTAALQASEQFTKPMPLILTAIGYAASFYFLSLVLRTMPVGIAYAIWSGLGIVLITLVGLVWFGQKLDVPAVVGLALIIAGVGTINLFSSTVSH